jgi:hypothetical protein
VTAALGIGMFDKKIYAFWRYRLVVHSMNVPIAFLKSDRLDWWNSTVDLIKRVDRFPDFVNYDEATQNMKT